MSPAGDLKIMLSSGTEDYFLGTCERPWHHLLGRRHCASAHAASHRVPPSDYFNKGGYENPVAGMTHKITENCNASAPKVHSHAP